MPHHRAPRPLVGGSGHKLDPNAREVAAICVRVGVPIVMVAEAFGTSRQNIRGLFLARERWGREALS